MLENERSASFEETTYFVIPLANSMLKPDLCNCEKTEIIEATAPSQQFLRTPCIAEFLGYMFTFG